MSEKRKTNLKVFGFLYDDPDPFTDSNNKLRVEVKIAHNPGKGQQAAFMEFITYKQDVGEYIVENFKKGDAIWVVNATPVGRRGIKKGQPNYKFVIWDVALKEHVEKKSSGKSFKGKDNDGDYE